MAFRSAWWIFLAALVATDVPARDEKSVEIKYSRQELEGTWATFAVSKAVAQGLKGRLKAS